MYSFASATTSLLGAKSSRRSVASTSRTLLSRLAREEASRRLGGTVVVLIRASLNTSILHQTLFQNMADFAANGQLSWEASIDVDRVSRMAMEALLLELRQAVRDISRRPLPAGALP